MNVLSFQETLALAYKYMQEGNYHDTLMLCKTYSGEHESNVLKLIHACVYTQLGLRSEAKNIYVSILEHDALDELCNLQMGILLLSEGDKNAARSYFERLELYTDIGLSMIDISEKRYLEAYSNLNRVRPDFVSEPNILSEIDKLTSSLKPLIEVDGDIIIDDENSSVGSDNEEKHQNNVDALISIYKY